MGICGTVVTVHSSTCCNPNPIANEIIFQFKSELYCRIYSLTSTVRASQNFPLDTLGRLFGRGWGEEKRGCRAYVRVRDWKKAIFSLVLDSILLSTHVPFLSHVILRFSEKDLFYERESIDG